MEGTYQTNINSLPKLGDNRYENIFKLYVDSDDRYFYNLKRSITFPDDINEEFIGFFQIDTQVPWTIVSYNIYGTIFMWWTITELNKISNPVSLPEQGVILKYIKPQYIKQVIAQINQQKDG